MQYFVCGVRYVSMRRITTYSCDQINSPKLFITDLRKYLSSDENYLHIVRGTLLCFCRKGEITIKVNYTTYNLKANDILSILPTHIFCLEEASEDAEVEGILYSDEYWASLSHSIDYKLIKAVEENPLSTLPEDGLSEAYTLLEMIKRHSQADEHEDIERSVASGLAFSLMMLLVSYVEKVPKLAPRPTTRKETLTHDFFELLSQYYETERQVSFYASKLFITPKHLSTMVKEVTHQSIQEWINNVTVLNIKHRLITTTDTIQQISEDLNFQTPSTFIRYFRQHTGITPSKYRTDRQKTEKMLS